MHFEEVWLVLLLLLLAMVIPGILLLLSFGSIKNLPSDLELRRGSFMFNRSESQRRQGS
jgi:hypothetical protein